MKMRPIRPLPADENLKVFDDIVNFVRQAKALFVSGKPRDAALLMLHAANMLTDGADIVQEYYR